MSPMMESDKKDDLIIIVDNSKNDIKLDQELKSIIVNRVQSAAAATPPTELPKSILKTSKLSKSFDHQPNQAKQPILKRHSFDICFPSSTKTTHSILKHSHSSNDEEIPADSDDQKPIKPILKKNKSFEHFQEANQLTSILKKATNHNRSD